MSPRGITRRTRIATATVLLSAGVAALGATPASADDFKFHCKTLTSTKDKKVADILNQLEAPTPTSATVGITCDGPDGGDFVSPGLVYGGKSTTPMYRCTKINNGYNGLITVFSGCSKPTTTTTSTAAQQKRARLLGLL